MLCKCEVCVFYSKLREGEGEGERERERDRLILKQHEELNLLSSVESWSCMVSCALSALHGALPGV